MRSSMSIKALALALLQGASAMDMSRMRQETLMAEQGLYADGSVMHTEEAMSSLLSANPPPPPTGEVIKAEYVELPLNHFGKKNSKDGTFFNRFWVSVDAYKPGSPVFLYDVGEANGENYVASRLGRNPNVTNSFRQMVDKYQGVGIVWEHRYCEFLSF